MNEVWLVEYNHNASGTEYFDALASSDTKGGADIIKDALTLKYRNGKLRVRKLAIETGEEEKYASWLRTAKED